MIAFYLSLIENHEDEDDFLEIYYKYKKAMYNIAFSYLKNHHYCEDAMQIAFSGIAKNMETVKRLNEEKQEIYILKSIKNAALNVLHKSNSANNNVYSIFAFVHTVEIKKQRRKA